MRDGAWPDVERHCGASQFPEFGSPTRASAASTETPVDDDENKAASQPVRPSLESARRVEGLQHCTTEIHLFSLEAKEAAGNIAEMIGRLN